MGQDAIAYQIPAGTLDSALKLWARQSRRQILYASGQVANRRAPGLSGSHEPDAALALLLQGSGFSALRINLTTYTLRPTPVAASARAPVSSTGAASSRQSVRVPEAVEMQPVEVIGTHIPGLSMITPRPVTLIDREQIKSSGYQSLFELLRVQPGVRGHHPVGVAFDNGQAVVPGGGAAAASLDALGPRAVLFLVDGRRPATYGLVSGAYGALFDLDSIPLNMVDYIEIQRGGASAIYGSDAIAGVVNIVLRKDLVGSEAVALYGLSSRGDAGTRRLSLGSGFDLSHGGHLFIDIDRLQRDGLRGDARQWHTDDLSRFGLPDARLELGAYLLGIFPVETWPDCPSPGDGSSGVCRLDGSRGFSLQPALSSTAGHGRYDIALRNGVHAHVDVRASQTTKSILSSPFSAAISVDGFYSYQYAFFDIGPVRNRVSHDTWSVASGFEGNAWGGNWSAHVARDRSSVTGRVSGLISISALFREIETGSYVLGRWDAPPEVRRMLSPDARQWGTFTQDTAQADFNRPVLPLPGGNAVLAVGASLRREQLRRTSSTAFLEGDIALAQETTARTRKRDHVSAYVELNMPLSRKLEVNVAGRIDHAGQYGDRFSPQAGFKWKLGERFILRGSGGHGYRTPTLYELRAPLHLAGGVYLQHEPGDPPCANPWGSDSHCSLEVVPQEMLGLRPEASRSQTLGMVWSPVPGLDVSLDRYRIVRRNEIQQVNVFRPRDHPDAWLFDEQGRLSGIALRYGNLAKTRVSGWDLDVRYGRDTRWGDIGVRLSGSYLELLENTSLVEGKTTDRIGFDLPRVVMAGSISWASGDWGTTLNLQHSGKTHAWTAGDSCPLPESGRCENPSATLLGLNLAWSGLTDWQFALNINNLTDRQPRNYAHGAGGYDISRDDPFGRYYVFSVARRF